MAKKASYALSEGANNAKTCGTGPYCLSADGTSGGPATHTMRLLVGTDIFSIPLCDACASRVATAEKAAQQIVELQRMRRMFRSL